MKKFRLFSLVMTLLVCVACNKDEDIVIDNPGNIPDNNFPTPLGYSVLEYTPAPGQYINAPANGSFGIFSSEDACKYAEKRLADSQYVSLGAWGGYIIVRFDNSIRNSGNYDFAIESNTFDSSSEPGIVWVMQDKNNNGLPDDTWYELKGSYFGKDGYERNYWVTYTRPDAKGDTSWIDSNGEKGSIAWVGNYHSQNFYYPDWIKEDTYTLYGSRLPSQARFDSATSTWTNLPFEWGYADNFGKDFIQDSHSNFFRISDAVTEKNTSVHLPSINFIKVQTAINGSAGWLGENSTEVTGFFSIN